MRSNTGGIWVCYRRPVPGNTRGVLDVAQTNVGAADVPESYDVAKEAKASGGGMLHGKAIGLLGVLFLTVTGAAPMSAMLGNVPDRKSVV